MADRTAQWKTDSQFDFGTPTKTNVEVIGSGDSAVVQLTSVADNTDNIPYTTAGNYTLSDGAKLEIASGSAGLKALTGGGNDWPFTTPANYTYDNTKIEVTGGVAKIKDNKTYVDFGGTDECAIVGDKASLDFGSNNFSVSFWIKTSSNANAQLVGKQDTGSGWYIYVNNATSTIYFYHRKDGVYVTSTTTISDGTWHHVVFVKNGSAGYIYIDDSDDTASSENISGTVDSSGDPFEIARRNLGGSPDRFFTGQLDSISVWDKALSSSEVTSLYNSGLPGAESSLASYSANCISWWKMGEDDTFPTLTDTKGSNDATMTNMESADIVTDITTSKIASNVGFVFTTALDAFEETATIPAGTTVRYQVSSDDGVSWKWYSGGWTAITGSQTDDWYYTNESNSASDINTNIGSLAASGTLQFRAFLHVTDAGSTPELSNIYIQIPTTFSTTDDLYIDTKDAVQIAPAIIYSWLEAVFTSVKPANTDARVLFSVDGRANWLTWSGSAWVAPASATARTDATSLSDASTNIVDLPVGDQTLDVRLFLYTSDNTVTPEVSNINVTSDTGYEATGSYESNAYQPQNNTNGVYMDSITFDVTVPAGTTLSISARHISHALETGYVEYETGDDIELCGDRIQWKAEFTSDGTATPTINYVEIVFHTLIGVMRSIDSTLTIVDGKVDTIITDIASVDGKIDTVDANVDIIKKIGTNRWKWDVDNAKWIIYDDDKTTPLYTLDVKDEDGNAATITSGIFDRVPT